MIGFTFRTGVTIAAIGMIGLITLSLLPVAATKDILDGRRWSR